MKIFEKKTKHHYVWAHYLREWTVDGNNIWYITKKSNVACDSVRGLGFEKNFYKLGILKESDKELISLFTDKSNDTLKKLHWDFVNMIFAAQKIFSLASPEFNRKTGLNLEEIMQSNIFENYLSQQESRVIEILSQLKKGNLLHLENKGNYYDLCYFLGYQFSRTLKMKQLMFLSLSKLPCESKIRERLKDFYERNWWFVCSFMATNLSYDMSLNSNRKLILIKNNSKIDFITSDQPIINLNPEGSKSEHVDYYYPLSPRKALLILTSGINYFSTDELNDYDVNMLNAKIATASCKTIFGNSREIMLSYIKDYNQREYLTIAGK